MPRTSQKARDLIVRWQFAGLSEDEFQEVTGCPFHAAAGLTWNDMDAAYARIEGVYRDRVATQDPHSGNADQSRQRRG